METWKIYPDCPYGIRPYTFRIYKDENVNTWFYENSQERALEVAITLNELERIYKKDTN